MAYIRTLGKGGELWRCRADTSNKLQLTVAPLEVFMAQYSPDGRRIAFMARAPGQPWKIYWVSNEGGAIHAISSQVVNQADPNWSPDSESIVFGQAPDILAEAGVPKNIYRYDLRTEQTSEIAGSEGFFSPRWSPDGRYLIAMSTDFQSLALLDFSNGKWRSLVQHFAANPFWSTDSAWVYFNVDEREHPIRRVRASGGGIEASTITIDLEHYIDCGQGSFAPNGAILIPCGKGNSDLYALDWE